VAGRKDWNNFCDYEKALNDTMLDQRMTVRCTYKMASSGAAGSRAEKMSNRPIQAV